MSEEENLQNFPMFDEFFSTLEIDRNLALKFFLVFSWFESQLSQQNYLDPKFNYPRVDWARYGNDYDEQFDETKTENIRQAVTYIRGEPPKVQRRRNEFFEWEVNNHPDARTELGRLLLWVRDVRNNFFHGGKFPFRPERDAELLKSCLIILQECIHVNQGVNKEYSSVVGEEVDSQ